TRRSVFGNDMRNVGDWNHSGISSVAYRIVASIDVSGPTHWIVIVVVGSRCQVRNSVDGVISVARGGTGGTSVSAPPANKLGRRASAAAKPPSEEPRKPRRCR